jgi:hypothetical protein
VADTKISAAADIATLASTDVFPVARPPQTTAYKATVAEMAAFMGSATGQLAGNRNAVINGAMDFWQRGTSFATPVNNSYTADRWAVFYDGGGSTFTIAQVSGLAQSLLDAGITRALNFNVTIAGSAGTFRELYHRIEGVRTLAGRTVMVSAWLWADAPISVGVALQQFFGTGGTPSSPVLQPVQTWAVTTTPTRFTASFTLPTISGQTLGTNGDDYLQLLVTFPVNVTFNARLTGVQVEPGVVATVFEWRPTGQELASCQRYYQRHNNIISGGYTIGGNVIYTDFSLPVTMYRIPAVTFSSQTYANASAFALRAAQQSHLQVGVTITATGYGYGVAVASCEGEL